MRMGDLEHLKFNTTDRIGIEMAQASFEKRGVNCNFSVEDQNAIGFANTIVPRIFDGTDLYIEIHKFIRRKRFFINRPGWIFLAEFQREKHTEEWYFLDVDIGKVFNLFADAFAFPEKRNNVIKSRTELERVLDNFIK